jgi:hypothetical protein
MSLVKSIFKLAFIHGVVTDARKPNQECTPVYPLHLIGSKILHAVKQTRRAVLSASLGRSPMKEYLRKNTHIVFHSLCDEEECQACCTVGQSFFRKPKQIKS